MTNMNLNRRVGIALAAMTLCALTLAGATGCALESAAAEAETAHELPYTPDPIGVEGLDAALTVADEAAAALAGLPEGSEIVEDENAPEGTVAVKTADGTVSYVPAASAGSTNTSTGSSVGSAASAPAAHVHDHAGSYDYVVQEATRIWHDPVYENREEWACAYMSCPTPDNCTHQILQLFPYKVADGYYETIPAQYAHVDACSCGYVW